MYHNIVGSMFLLLAALYSCQNKEPASREIVPTNKKIIIENFEGDSYRAWVKSGNAFSTSLAPESELLNMGVIGKEGSKIMTSYWPNGDNAKGQIKSPEFTIDLDFFNFLVGGGGDIENTYVALFIDGKEFKRQAGCNDFNFEQVSWDVSEYKGHTAYVLANDSASHAWGFIQFDYIYLSDKPAVWRKYRQMSISGNYLNFPVSHNDNIENIRLYDGEEVVYDIDLRLTDGTPDYWVSIDCRELKGKDIDVSVMFNSFINVKTPLVYSAGLNSIFQSDVPVDKEVFYIDGLRPRAHFSANRGWLNDPNALYYYNGTWHLSFQHNPFGPDWGNIHWGHAYCTDLYHWTQTDDILKPDSWGVPFSGYAIVDKDNVLGLQTGADPTIAAIYTAAGENGYMSRSQLYSQCLAYSNDAGMTWKRYENNPVLPFYTTNTRDPQTVWSEEDNKWVMVVFLYDNEYAFFESTDLLHWTETSRFIIPNEWECPDFYKIKVEETGELLWVLSGVHSCYFVGNFEGGTFSPVTSVASQDLNREYLAPHTFVNAPDGRRIQVGCIGNGDFPKLPFNQAISFPKELTLHKYNGTYRLYAVPCVEIENGHIKGNTISVSDKFLSNASNSLTGGAFHIKSVYDLNRTTADNFGFNMDGILFTYDRRSGSFSVSEGLLSNNYSGNSTIPANGLVEIEIIYDCSILEVFVNSGEYSLTATFKDKISNKKVATIAQGGDVYVKSLVMAELEPFWN